tara:strand:- start:1219 stop:2040 length:822 start_codon:yes stop_codon:yes gene_type:complete
MYIVNNIILLEMPKSGSSFLRRFFNFYFGHNNIKRSGIHNGISSVKIRDKINNGDIKVISSIRNPFDWYVSNYFFGRDTRDGYYRNIGLRRNEFSLLGIKSTLKNPNILFRDVSEWKRVYDSNEEPFDLLFQDWLHLVLTDRSKDLYNTYGKVADRIGLFTYLFLKIHTFNFNNKIKEFVSTNNTLEFYHNNKIRANVLSMENLVDELINSFEYLGINKERGLEVLNEMKSLNSGLKVNSSNRGSYPSYYGTKEIDLVSEKDRDLIKMYNYNF